MGTHFRPSHSADSPDKSRELGLYAWIAFALVFGLMLSDYLSRQVITSIFPLLKSEWDLTDTQLGSLVSVVSLTVGVLTLPISFLADRWGLVKSATLMALCWAMATVACGFAGNFLFLFVARALVGLAEAGYGSAGAAILTSIFPLRLHATVIGSFVAAGLFGSVLGVGLGGVLADLIGWRNVFIVVGAAGALLAVVFPLVVREPPRAGVPSGSSVHEPVPVRAAIGLLFSSRTAVFTYIGAGFQWFTTTAVVVWIPSYFNRYYGLAPKEAGLQAGALLLVSAIGMTVCGMLADRLSRRNAANKLRIAAIYAALTCALLVIAFAQPPGPAQIILIGVGIFVAGGTAGPAGAIVVQMTDARIRATALGFVTVCNQLLGVAAGPFVTGLVADHVGLKKALGLAPLVSLLAFACLLLAYRHCKREQQSLAQRDASTPA